MQEGKRDVKYEIVFYDRIISAIVHVIVRLKKARCRIKVSKGAIVKLIFAFSHEKKPKSAILGAIFCA
jgi:hypothetical protein